MDIDSLAQALFGSKRAETQEVSTDGTTRTYTGVALTDSEDGTVVIDLGGDVTLPDDLYDSEGNVVAEWDGVGVEMPTSPQVSAGDDVIVTLMGGSSTKTPMVTSSAGSGDRMRALINAAQTVADAAQAVAEAVNQHFFADASGIHVTEATQEDWDESHTGANVLINSIGQLFRDGLTNLLTLTTQNGARALAIWDGLGNNAENVLAQFSADGTRIGAESSAHSVWESGEFVFNDGTNDTMKLSAPESITETHVIPSYSSTSYYAYIELEYPPASLISVEVDNTEYTYTPTMTPYGLKLRKHEATFSGETVTVTYKPSPAMYIYDGVGDGSSNVATRINANKVSLAKDVFSISTAYDLSSGSIEGGDVRIGDSEASRSEIMLRYSSDRSYVTFQTTGGNRTAAFVLDTGSSSEPERSLDLIYIDKINYIDPYDNYKVLGRPTRLTANKSMTLTDTSGWTDGPSVDLTQGHWLVVGVACFNTGSSSGVRKLRTQLRLGTSVYAEGTEINVANNAFGRVEAVAIMSASSATTATLVLNSGMTFTTAATSYITAILLT